MSTDTSRTKIAFLVTKSNWGGAQKNVYDIATHLDPKRYDVVVILGGHGLLKKKLSEVGIRTVSVDSMDRDINFKKEFKNFIEIYKLLKQEKPDILHVHSPKASGIGSFIGRLLKIKKIIYTVHGWSFNEDRPLTQKILIVFFSWLTTLLATNVITISQKDRVQTEQFPYIGNKLVYIPNGIREHSTLREHPAREFLEHVTGVSLKEKFLVGMLGELNKNKGYIYAIQAMADIVRQHPDIILIIIGSGEQEEMLKKMIASLHLQSHVFLLGFIDSASQYAKAFDMFLMPSIKEGLPYALLELGMAGIPVVASAIGGIPDIIDDMRSGILIQPAKNQEITYAVTFMYEHPDLRVEYGRNIVKKIKTDFNLQKMLQLTEKVYITEVPKTHSS